MRPRSVSTKADVQARGNEAGKQTVLTFTPYEANTFMLRFTHSGVKILVDPWFVGNLVFAGQSWFAEGSKRTLKDHPVELDEITRDVDLILLAQDLDDHTHRPTLAAIRKTIRNWTTIGRKSGPYAKLRVGGGTGPWRGGVPVCPVCMQRKPLAVKRACSLVNTWRSKGLLTQKAFLGGRISVKATVGALVGAPFLSKRQNGYVISEEGGISLYYEPHANFSLKSLRSVAPVDVVITPTTTTYTVAFPLVEGRQSSPEVLRVLQPKVVIPLENNSLDIKGLLGPTISATGSNDPAEVDAWLRREGVKNVRVAGPQAAGKELEITL